LKLGGNLQLRKGRDSSEVRIFGFGKPPDTRRREGLYLGKEG
jgi:hypothetical protein